MRHRTGIVSGHAPLDAECGHSVDLVAKACVWAAVVLWAALGIYVSATDLREGIIPRRAVWAAGVAIVASLCTAALLASQIGRWAWAVCTAAAVAALFEVVYRFKPGRIGYGDVRLIVANTVIAGWWGPQWALWALFAGAVAAWPVAMVALIRGGRGAQVRWAPGLVAGTALVLAWKLYSPGALGLVRAGGS